MGGSGIFFIIGLVVIGIFGFGCWFGARSFESRMSRLVAGILCGLGAVAIVAGIAFGGCLLILSGTNFH